MPDPVVRSSDGPAIRPSLLPEFRLLPSTQSLLPVFTKPQIPLPKLQSKSASSVKVPGRQRKRVGLKVGVLVGTEEGNGVGTGDGRGVGSGVGTAEGSGEGCGVGKRVGKARTLEVPTSVATVLQLQAI